MLGAEMAGHGARVGRLVIARLVEADRIGPDRSVALRPHHCRNRRGVDAAREKRAERHVGDEPPRNRIAQQCLERVGGFSIAHL